jgi:DNA-directed RNA polymerase subunit F
LTPGDNKLIHSFLEELARESPLSFKQGSVTERLQRMARKVQPIRSIVKKKKTYDTGRDFPKDKPGVIYVRQSTVMQIQRNLHSFEMQTNDFVEHFRGRGVTGTIEIIADDEGKSGTLDIHKRSGLSRTVSLIEGAELLGGERIGWVAAVNVSRLTRDEWLIVPGELMRACYEHDVWISTLRMDFNFQDEYCRRVFMLEAEEAARHLKWMKEVLGGGLQAASNKGVYDGRDMQPGYIIDYREYIDGYTVNPNYKKFRVYEPHAERTQWLFQRYFELDGNFPVLCREVEALHPFYPPFDRTEVHSKNLSEFTGRKTMTEQGYTPTAHGLLGILTNPVYIGWWIPRNGGLIEHHHEALVSEELFSFAHKRLSTHDFAGNRVKPIGTTRNGQAEALLKKVIEAPDGSPFYPFMASRGYLVYRARIYGKLTREEYLSVAASHIDRLFLGKFFERLQEWSTRGELAEWRERQKLAHESHEEHNKNVRKSIKQAHARRQEIMDTLADPEIPKTKQMRIDYAQQVAGLEGKIAELEEELKILPDEEDSTALYRIWDLIPALQQHWNKLLFKDRLRVVNAFTRRVILSTPSPGWLKMEIEWKIGQKDTMHERRSTNGKSWTPAEEAIIRELWPTGDGGEILRQLPDRSYSAIKKRAGDMGLRREQKGGSVRLDDYFGISMQDMQYAREHQLDIVRKEPQWGSMPVDAL